MHRTPARLVTASLLLASAAAFTAGVAAERATAGSESHAAERHATATATPSAHALPVPATATSAVALAPTPAKGGDGDNGEPAASGETGAAHAAESQSEKLFGINPEATGLLVIALALSVLLAVLILSLSSPLVPAGIAAAALAFTVLDVREVTHQLTESRSGLAALAATVALLHLLTAASALLVARATRGPAGRPTGQRLG
jgi:hypothetical protein